MKPKFIPDDEIPTGDETNRLHRWGYRHYREMFNQRQLVGLELSASLISKITNERIRNALATNLSDLLRYQNMLCRYDASALKSLDIFSVHGFPVGLIQCESNLLGIMETGRNMCVGSGGWANIIEKFKKAKSYCDCPFEIKHQGRSKKIIPINGEWIGDHHNGDIAASPRIVNLICSDAASYSLPDSSLDAVLTDPPYFGNVQYAELMDFCYVWLRKLVGRNLSAFKASSTRTPGELTGNADMGRGLDHFTEGLSSVFQRMARALKPGAPLAFTYHHNNLEAYYPIAVAILDAGLTCSASIHINGTGSSIIDTVFVCRQTGIMQRKWLAESANEMTKIVEDDLALLRSGNIQSTSGDIRCITYAHLVRLAIWSLRKKWDKTESTMKRLEIVKEWLNHFGNMETPQKYIENYQPIKEQEIPLSAVHEEAAGYGESDAYISF